MRKLYNKFSKVSVYFWLAVNSPSPFYFSLVFYPSSFCCADADWLIDWFIHSFVRRYNPCGSCGILLHGSPGCFVCWVRRSNRTLIYFKVSWPQWILVSPPRRIGSEEIRHYDVLWLYMSATINIHLMLMLLRSTVLCTVRPDSHYACFFAASTPTCLSLQLSTALRKPSISRISSK